MRRAVQAGLEITREVDRLSDTGARRDSASRSVSRFGIHRGLVYLDIEQDDVYGLGANLASRVSGLAPPGSVVVSGTIEPPLARRLRPQGVPAQAVKGIESPVEHYQVVAVKLNRTGITVGPLVGRDEELAASASQLG